LGGFCGERWINSCARHLGLAETQGLERGVKEGGEGTGRYFSPLSSSLIIHLSA